jgi:hypothetical protein
MVLIILHLTIALLQTAIILLIIQQPAIPQLEHSIGLEELLKEMDSAAIKSSILQIIALSQFTVN